jgi:hypothetical protein
MLRVLLPLAAGLFALAACKTTTPPVTPARYNVLFISLDTVRQDVLGIYGHHPRHAPELSTTPNLDRFAYEGVRMAEAYASSSWTLPSHLSMMTGLPALAHGVETESGVLVRIPMLLRLPGVLPADRTVLGAVSVSDLLPTILEILGLPHEAQPGSASFLAAMTNGGTADQTPILRTIMMFAGQVQLDGRLDDKDAITVRQVVVRDGFRHGTIKIARGRSWPQFEAGLAPEVTTILNREAAAQYQQEVLQWWDVARSPGEPEESASTDFTDAAAHAGLVAFQRAYAAALARRPAAQALPHNIRTKLESLGYLERATGPTFPEPDLVLPVPGAGLIPPEL